MEIKDELRDALETALCDLGRLHAPLTDQEASHILNAVAPLIAGAEKDRAVDIIKQTAETFRMCNNNMMGSDTTAGLLVVMFAEVAAVEIAKGEGGVGINELTR